VGIYYSARARGGSVKFSKDFLRSMSGKTIRNEIIDHSRWTVSHERIFEHDGHLYSTTYSVGATEQQDESPYEYDDEEIECPEVAAVERTVTVYEVVK
jgi:hypothetical protein